MIVRPLIEALLNAGARVDESSLKHQTPLMTAVEYGRLKTVQLLLDHGANPLARDDNDKLPIHHMIVASHNPLPIAELLVKLGNDVNAVDALGITPLMITDDLPTRRFLLAKGANINAQAKNGDNALLRATGVGDTKAIQLMLDHGAKVELLLVFNAICHPRAEEIRRLKMSSSETGLSRAKLADELFNELGIDLASK